MFSQLQKKLHHLELSKNHRVSKRAGIILPLINVGGEESLLLTLRSTNLRSHAGQVACPGGKMDKEDLDIQQTALREAKEEIGLQASQVQIIGQLEEIISRNLYLVTPFVGIVDSNFIPTINHDEIEKTFIVPISFFLDEKSHSYEEKQTGTYPYLIHYFHYQNDTIWGLTALLILRLLEVGMDYQPSYPIHHPEGKTWMELSQLYQEGIKSQFKSFE